MQADLICVGSELLTGLVENSNTGFLARRLWGAGIPLRESSVVADNEEAIRTALNRGLEMSDLVILTGGLGPTDDDITREAVAAILGLPLVLNRGWLDRMEELFTGRGLKMPDNNRKQAYVIEGAILLENRRGTAPGLIIRWKEKLIILLPGPPYEMQAMFEEAVLPVILNFNKSNPVTVKTLKCIGMGESMLEEKIKALDNRDLPSLSYVARGYEVDLQIKGMGNPGSISQSIENAERILRAELGDYIFGSDEDTLAGLVAELLTGKGLTLALAESCSGGLLSDTITDIPGSSKFYRGGIIAYSRKAKINLLVIKEEMLEREGEVSEATAGAMAEGVRALFGADYGIGITGIAGPESDASQGPVGLVFVAVAYSGGSECKKLQLGGGRRSIKERAAQFALDLLRRKLIGG
jgi:nicotinamide-nucleotide amidase